LDTVWVSKLGLGNQVKYLDLKIKIRNESVLGKGKNTKD